MCTILRLSRQLVYCLCRVVGHSFHSQHFGGRCGSACERLGVQVNVLQGRHLTNKCEFFVWSCEQLYIAALDKGLHLATAAGCRRAQPTTPESVYSLTPVGRHFMKREIEFSKYLERGSNPRPRGWRAGNTTTRPRVLRTSVYNVTDQW